MRAAVVSSRQQLNRLNSVERDRGAADKSTESVRSRDPGQRERGSRRSGERFLCRFLLARRRRSAGLSQFVERYRRVGRPFSVLPVLQIICRKCSTRAFTAFSVSELVGADNEGPTPPPRPKVTSPASAWNVPTHRATGRRAPRPPPTSPWKTSPALTPRATTCRSRASSPTSLTIVPSFLVYAGLYTAHLISAESSVTSIRSMNCAATIFFSSKLRSEKTSFSGIAGLDFSRLREARISFRSFSRRASAR